VWTGLWIVVMAAAVLTRPLMPVDETRYLAVAWEMWFGGDFLVPHLNGETYSHKPPLLFWLINLGWGVFGVNEWWPRLVAPLFGLASLFLTARLARELWPDHPTVTAIAPLMLFGAALGPEMFCPDRRSGALVLYLVRPITVRDYLLARWLGFFTVSLAILWLPQLLLFATRAFTAENPLEWLQDHPMLLPQIALSGIALAALLTTIALAVSSFTDRRPYAAASVLGLLIGSIVVAGIAAEIAGGTTGDWLELMNLLLPVNYLNNWIFGEGSGPLSAPVYVGQLVAIVGLGWAILWWRYRGVSS